MLSENEDGISVDILGKQHKFSCSESKANDLQKAANELAAMCLELKQKKSTMNNEQTLLVAAMNLSYSLLTTNAALEENINQQKALIAKLQCVL